MKSTALKRLIFISLVLVLSICSISAQTQTTKSEQVTLPGSTQQLKLVYIPAGNFMMGNANGKANEQPIKQVQLSGFWMGAYEITHDQYNVFFRDENLSQGSKVDAITRPTAQYIDLSWNMGKEGGFPMNSMSVDAAMMFCKWLWLQTGVFYRLPTEAEWEYACRAGSSTNYFYGNDPKLLSQFAWFKGNSKEKYQKVGTKKPNAWGLYDMLGNVAEWTLDQYDSAYLLKLKEGQLDPITVPTTRYPRSIRGGSYLDDASGLTVSKRSYSLPSWNKRDPQIPKSRWWLTDGMFVGFRIVRPEKQPSTEEAEKFYKLYLEY